MKKFLQLNIASVLCVCLALPAMAQTNQQAAIDQSFETIESAVKSQELTEVLQIDHARLAAAVNVEMPPARVQLFSDAAINAALMQDNIRAGLDLPFRVLSYEEKGTSAVSYASADFLAKRHGLTDTAALSSFDARMNDILAQLSDLNAAPTPTDSVTRDFAVLELASPYSVPDTVARLKAAVTAQSDTIWFGEINFQTEASEVGVTLPAAQLLLFGGPAPGGVAMADYPAIGLDAFCQKLLVFEDGDGKTVILFNDIKALAELYYASSIKPHEMLNQRLTATFSDAAK